MPSNRLRRPGDFRQFQGTMGSRTLSMGLADDTARPHPIITIGSGDTQRQPAENHT